MIKKHGTADKKVIWTPGQFVEAQVPILRALHKALEGREPKIFIEKLSKSGQSLTAGFGNLFNEIMSSNIFSLTLEGRYTASQLIEMGKYDWFNNWITDERFPINKHKPINREIELIEFDFDPSSEEVLRELERRGLERPIYEDGFYFGIEHPEKQRERPIVFLHEPVLVPGGDRSVLVLSGDAGGRGLYLDLFDCRWDRRYVFAGVCK